MEQYDVIVIGGGQSGLAVGYYLRRTGLSYIILDAGDAPGGSWPNTWKSLRLFSPAQWSSLPGTIMKGGVDYYPTRDEVIKYLGEYEEKYALPVQRAVFVKKVQRQNGSFLLDTNKGAYLGRAIINATGTYANPTLPKVPNQADFHGKVLHAAQYREPAAFEGQRVIVVGEGNSGAQIIAEVSKVTDTVWSTKKDPQFLSDDIDGRYLFDAATQMYEARKQGKAFKSPSLGDIVMIAPVKEARERGVLKNFPPIERFTSTGVVLSNGEEEKADVVIFCTGFAASLHHLDGLAIFDSNGKVPTKGNHARHIEGLWFVGYGNWTGFASATLIGVGRSAKKTVEEVKTFVARGKRVEQH